MKVCLVLGTRPEIIKLYSVIKELGLRKVDFFVIHTGQHYSFKMDKVFFNELNLNFPDYQLNINSCNHGEMTGRMLIEIEKIMIKESPDVVLVQGDTNSVLAGALTASKLNIKVGHIEAGLRSYDRNMPEEINRVIVDHISDYLFAPTELCKKNLLAEGISNDKIFVVGNTIVDILSELVVNNDNFYDNIKEKLLLEKKEYAVLTLHRPSNVDDKQKMVEIFSYLDDSKFLSDLKIIFPVHPRTKNKIESYNIDLPKNVIQIDPVGYLHMMSLLRDSKFVLTDSGGIQEEACVLQVPCLTLRSNTERPETVEVGSNFIVGDELCRLKFYIENLLSKDKNWHNPFGDGKTAIKIIDIIKKYENFND